MNVTERLCVADRAVVAKSPLKRLLGLLPRHSLDSGEAMIFPRCRSIHTFGMRFAIDVVFLRGPIVVKVVPALGGGKMASDPQADTIIELAAGGAENSRIMEGTVIDWSA